MNKRWSAKSVKQIGTENEKEKGNRLKIKSERD
jgi:hypothetical protein